MIETPADYRSFTFYGVTLRKTPGLAFGYISPFLYEDTASILHANQQYLTTTGLPPLTIKWLITRV